MKKKSKSVPKIDPYIDGLMAKLLERLVNIEKKIDRMVSPPPSRERVLYEAVCADCSKVCEVPFKPSEDRPVYCKECWARRKSLPDGRQVARSNRPGMLVLTPVALPPKTASKLSAAAQASIKKKQSKPRRRK